MCRIKEEMEEIEVSKSGLEIMAPKFLFNIFKIKDLDIKAANILKQDMLSLGGEAAVCRGVADFTAEKTDVLLGGTLKHYIKLLQKLESQPFGLSEVCDKLRKFIDLEKNSSSTKKINLGKYSFNLDKTIIMGILNVTPDSFSDGGKYLSKENAVAQAIKMKADGADIIDIGGESSRPGAIPVPVEEELSRVVDVVKDLVDSLDVAISIDTYKPEVAEKCLGLGAHIINDITGLKNEKMAQVISDYGAGVVIMHMQGNPQNMQINPKYNNVIDDIFIFFKKQIEIAEKHGIENIILDPGIGFGKTLEHNLKILANIPVFRKLGYPILIGTSRKSFLGNLTGLPVEKRIHASISSATVASLLGADMLRVHDVKETSEAIKIVDAIKHYITL